MPRKSMLDDYGEIYKRQKELKPDPQVGPNIVAPKDPSIDIQKLPLKNGGEAFKLSASNLPHLIIYNTKNGKRYRSAKTFDGYVYEIDDNS